MGKVVEENGRAGKECARGVGRPSGPENQKRVQKGEHLTLGKR